MHNHHNFAWREEHAGRTYWVIRKGCTPARPGREGFVGGSMGDESVILEGVDSGEAEESLFSTVHGAGRVMSRTAAAGRVRRRKRWACTHRDCHRVFDADAISPTAGAPQLGACPDHPDSRLKKVWIEEQMKPGKVDWPAVQARLREQGIVLIGGGADEAPEVYKRLPDVLAAHAGSIRVKHAATARRGHGGPRRLRPIQGLRDRRPAAPQRYWSGDPPTAAGCPSAEWDTRIVRRAAVICVMSAALGIGASTASGVDPAAAAQSPVTAVPVSATEGEQFSGEVGTYSGCGPVGPATATVDWGDGSSPSPATLTLIPGTVTCEIIASHTYAEEGSDTTTVTVTTSTAGPATATGTAAVADAPLTVTGRTLGGSPGTPTSGVVATVQDAGGLEPVSHYTASISWGDGHSSTATVGADGSVSGSNTYAIAGSYSPTVTVFDDGGQTATASATATITAPTPPLPSSPPPCAAIIPTVLPRFTPTAADPDARWVQALYHDVLDRSPDSSELQYFTGAVGAGATRVAVVSYLEGDPDRPIIIGSLYNEFLHRPPDPAGLSSGEQFLAQGGTDEQLSAVLLGSPEYLTTRGGGTTPGFLGSLYCDLLHRTIDPTSLATFEQALAAGATRQQVAQQVLSSTEYRRDLVTGFYLSFLHRVPSLSELGVWIGDLQMGATDEHIVTALLSSQEYFNDYNAAPGVLVSPAITGLGVIHVTLRHAATLELKVLELLPAVQKSSATTTKPKIATPRTRQLGVVNLGRHSKGRVTIHWNRKVGKRLLKPGRYVLLLEAGSDKKLADVSDAIDVTLS